MPTSRKKDIEKQRETPASRALETVAGLWFVLGVPTAILLTIFLGAWWAFFPAVVGAIFWGAVSEGCKKPREES